MAIVDQVQELKAGLSAIKSGLASAIQNKGVTVTSDMKLKDFPALVQSIELGIDADLTGLEAVNIKAGVTINGITGNFTADADALSTDLRLNKIAYVNGNKITGKMADVSVYKDGHLTVGINEGYSIGSSITLSDDNLIANNIKKGVSIFGITGDLEIPELSNLVPENIKEGVVINGVTGTYTGGVGNNSPIIEVAGFASVYYNAMDGKYIYDSVNNYYINSNNYKIRWVEPGSGYNYNPSTAQWCIIVGGMTVMAYLGGVNGDINSIIGTKNYNITVDVGYSPVVTISVTGNATLDAQDIYVIESSNIPTVIGTYVQIDNPWTN